MNDFNSTTNSSLNKFTTKKPKNTTNNNSGTMKKKTNNNTRKSENGYRPQKGASNMNNKTNNTRKPNNTPFTEKNSLNNTNGGFTQPALIKNPERFKKDATNNFVPQKRVVRGANNFNSSDSENPAFSELSGFKVVVGGKCLVDEEDENVRFEYIDGEKRAKELFATSGFSIGPNPTKISLPSFA
jgi:hypothetical protein